MRLLALELSNFMVFGKTSWIVDRDGRSNTLIKGTIDGQEISNGAGKSSFLEAFYWCVTGKAVRDIVVDEIPRLGTAVCSVTAICELASGMHTFTRVWSQADKKVTINYPNDEKEIFHDSDQGTRAILNLLGISKELLSLIGFFGKKFTTFSRLGKRERAELIDILARGERWEQARVLATSKGTLLDRDIVNFGNQIDNLVVRKTQVIAKIGDLQAKLLVAEEEVEIAKNAKRKQIEDLQKQHTDKLAEKRKLGFIQDKDKSNLVLLEEDLADGEGIQEGLMVTWRELSTQLATYTAEVKQYNIQIAKYEKTSKHTTCPFCEQGIDHKKLKGHSDQLLQQVAKVRGLENEIKLKKHTLDKEIAATKDALRDCRGDITTLNNSITVATRKMSALDLVIQKITGNISLAEQAIDTLVNSTQVVAYQEQIKMLQTDTLDQLEVDMATLKDTQKDALVRRRALEYWAKGMRNIRFIMMEKVADLLTKYITSNALSLNLNTELVKVFAWKPTGKRKAVKPEIFIKLSRGEHKLSLEALSEGETQKVDLACFLAMGQLITHMLGVDIQFRVFDEPLTGLDSVSKSKAFNLITTIPNVSQCFVIDHDAHFQDQFNSIITISQEGGVSQVLN